MTNPLTAIAPVDAIVEGPTRANDSPAMQQLAEKFEALMRDGHAIDTGLQPSPEPNALLRVASAQEDMLRQTMRDIDEFAARTHDMTNAEIAAEQIRLSNEVAMSALYFSFATHAAQDANKSLQTLLKNQ